MHARSLRRSAALAAVVSLACAGMVSADAVRVDRVVTPNSQTPIELGEVGRGAILTYAVPFELICAGTSHVDPGQTITLTRLAVAAPTGGEVVSVTPGQVGPLPDGWPSDGSDCGDPLPTSSSGTPSMVTLRAPVTPNVGYIYTVAYTRTLAPEGSDDANAVRGANPSVSFRLAVVDDPAPVDNAPVLTLPPSFTAEGDTTGGWIATYPGVSAIDAEDDPDPVPTPTPGRSTSPSSIRSHQICPGCRTTCR